MISTLQKPVEDPRKAPQLSGIYIVVPAYNEGAVICDTVRPLLSLGYSIIIVDDGSTDDTCAQACTLPVHVLRHPINQGQGAALQTGMDFALKCGARAVVHFDADGQHPPERLQALLSPILTQQVDIALASRFLDPAHARDIPRLKKYILKLGILFTGLTTGVWLTDTHNGLRAFSRRAAETVRITEPRMAHASQIIGLIGKSQLRYREIPAQTRYTPYSRRKGQSVFNALNIAMDLLLRRVFR